MAADDAASMDVFEVVSHDTRADVLRELADAHRESSGDLWVPYNELRRCVGERDSGNFNYHLKQLDGLVEKGPEGYRLSRVGMRVVSALRSGFFDPDWTWGPVEAPGECYACGGDLDLYYEDGALHVTCGDDDHRLSLYVPPAFLQSQPTADVVEQVAFLENRWGSLTRRGICSECHGYVDGELQRGDGETDPYRYHGDCHRCGFQHVMSLGMFLLGHPTVMQFYFEHGVDVRTVPFWTLPFCTPDAQTVVSRDPLRVRLDVTEAGETLSLTVDGVGDVVQTTRT